eukprot:4938605-Prymnesium_polylepis.1
MPPPAAPSPLLHSPLPLLALRVSLPPPVAQPSSHVTRSARCQSPCHMPAPSTRTPLAIRSLHPSGPYKGLGSRVLRLAKTLGLGS